MPELQIDPDKLTYTIFALTLSQLNESDRHTTVERIQALLRQNPGGGPKIAKAELTEGSDEFIAFRSDVAAKVLRELILAGKITRLIDDEADLPPPVQEKGKHR
jgi:hypothetical protein